MSKLDELKAKLTELEAGYAVEFHESTVAEAIEDERKPLHAYPSASDEFQSWCAENKIRIFHMSLQDRIGFEKMTNAAKTAHRWT